MKSMGKILFFFGLFVFISGQSAYAQGFGGITSGVSKSLGGIKSGLENTINSNISAGKELGSKTLDTMGAAIKPVKNITGDFIGKYTNSHIGGFVKNSSWRNVVTTEGLTKASGILQGTASGILGGDGKATAIKKGGLTGSDLAKGAFHNNPNRGGFSINVNSETPSTEMFYDRDNSGKIIETPVYTDNIGNQLTKEFNSLTHSPKLVMIEGYSSPNKDNPGAEMFFPPNNGTPIKVYTDNSTKQLSQEFMDYTKGFR